MSDDRDIGYALFGFGFGIWSFFWGFKRLRRKRIIENIPTSTIRGLAIGLTEIIGEAKKTASLKSPLTQMECVFYRYTAERYQSSGRSGRWVTIAKGDSCFSPFWLDDGTGKIMVLPAGAEFILPNDYEFSTGWGRSLPSNLINFMENNGLSYKAFIGTQRLRFKEWYIGEGEKVYVLGTAKKQRNALEDYNKLLVERLGQLKADSEKMAKVDLNKDGEISMEEWNLAVANVERKLLQEKLKTFKADNPTDVVITKGEMQKIFIISDHSQKELTEKLSWQAFSGVFGGAALTLAMLAYLLFRFQYFKF
ncbi:MAG: GIDE domain-containing protein [Candidatus Omnitrophota bacterium]